MTEEVVRQIAEQFVATQGVSKCSIEAVRRFKRSEVEQPTTVGDEWVVQFRFDTDEDGGEVTNPAIVVVDDATGAACFFDSL